MNKSELVEVIGKLVEEVRNKKDVFASIHIYGNELSINICPWDGDEE